MAPDGSELRRAVVRHGGSAVILALDERKRVLMVRQYRLPAGRNLWELPAGKLDEGETAFAAARRELLEETGYRAARWRRLVSFYPSPGILSEKMTIYLATGVRAGESQPMADELIEWRWFEADYLDACIRDGRISDGKTIIGFLAWQRYHRDEG